jgi:hypothetical protein
MVDDHAYSDSPSRSRAAAGIAVITPIALERDDRHHRDDAHREKSVVRAKDAALVVDRLHGFVRAGVGEVVAA